MVNQNPQLKGLNMSHTPTSASNPTTRLTRHSIGGGAGVRLDVHREDIPKLAAALRCAAEHGDGFAVGLLAMLTRPEVAGHLLT